MSYPCAIPQKGLIFQKSNNIKFAIFFTLLLKFFDLYVKQYMPCFIRLFLKYIVAYENEVVRFDLK